MSAHRLVVVGLGRAGRARVREIEGSSRAALAAIVSRHDGSSTAIWADALADDHVEAVVICTENATHGALVRAALEARKHVAVEFPLCLDPAEGRALFALSGEQERVLHVEHIELLTPGHAQLRERLARIGAVRRGELRFQGGAGGWIVDFARGGFPSFTGIARLHVLWDLFGPLSVRSASLDRKDEGFHFEARLQSVGGARITWSEERREGLSRGKRFRFEGEQGAVTHDDLEPSSGGPSLFGLDLDLFLDRLEGAPEPPGERKRILGALEVAAECQRLAEAR